MIKTIAKELGILFFFLFLFLFTFGIFSSRIESHIVLLSSGDSGSLIFSLSHSLALGAFFLIGKLAYFLLPLFLSLILGILFHPFFFKLSFRGFIIVLGATILVGLSSPYPEWLEGGMIGNFFSDILHGNVLDTLSRFLLGFMIAYQVYFMLSEILGKMSLSKSLWKSFFTRSSFIEKKTLEAEENLFIAPSLEEGFSPNTLPVLKKEKELSIEELLKVLEWNSSKVKLSEIYAHISHLDIFGNLLTQFIKNLYSIQVDRMKEKKEEYSLPSYKVERENYSLDSIERASFSEIVEVEEYWVKEEKNAHQILEETVDITSQSLLEQFYLTDRLKDVFNSLEHSFFYSPAKLSPLLADIGVPNSSRMSAPQKEEFSYGSTNSLPPVKEEVEEEYDSFESSKLREAEIIQEEEMDKVEYLLELYGEEQEQEESTMSSLLNEVESETIVDFQFPSLGLLEEAPPMLKENSEDKELLGEQILSILGDFNIKAELSNITVGPVVTRYEIIPPKGLKVNRIIELDDNIALGIASKDRIRIEAPVFGKSVVGIEVPNFIRETVSFKEIVNQFTKHSQFKDFQIPFLVGKTLDGEIYVQDLVKTPHLLIAGSTGSGKSVCVNTLINSILYHKSPKEVRLLLMDPKRVELILYDGLPHLIAPVIKEPNQAIKALKWLVQHMEERYILLENERVRNIAEYNLLRKQQGQEIMPYIVTVMDEFADLILLGKREVEESVIRLAAMARAVGIHLVLATQRPSADVITGLIKANFPSRIAFKVSSKMESRIILDENGAENLLGKGDMLFLSSNGGSTQRIQAPLIADEEVRRVSQFFKNHYSAQYWDAVLEDNELEEGATWEDGKEDPLFRDAVEIVLRERKASASYLQRRLKIGYNRAARLIEMMEEMGMISRGSGSKPREVLVDEWEY